MMKISIIQSDLAWEDKLSNFQHLGKLISPLFNKTDIVILPEMFNTGFSMNPVKFSESFESETFEWLKNTAIKGNFGLCGSYMVKEKSSFFNRFVFVTPETKSWYYDKCHLFSMGEEDRFFSPGKTRLVFSFRGIRISPYICYDLRFPVWSRNRNDCDLMIYVANWPENRRGAWHTLLKARAIENQCFVAGANRVGIDGNSISYCGDSMIIDSRGETISSADTNEECVISGEISLTELTDFRKKFPVLNDADNFSINFYS